MSDHEQESGKQPFHTEGTNIIFDPPVDPKETARQRREDEQHEFARSQVNTNRRLAWFTGALVLATFCTIGVGIWQGVISQNAANAAKSAADTAKQSLDLTGNSIKASEAAVFFFDVGTVGYTPRTVRVSFRNQGKMPARGFSGWIEVGYVHPQSGKFKQEMRFPIGGPNHIVSTVFPDYYWIEMTLPAFSNTPTPPYKQTHLPRISARIRFDNGFGDITQQDFCEYFWNGNWIDCGTIDSLIQFEKQKDAKQ